MSDKYIQNNYQRNIQNNTLNYHEAPKPKSSVTPVSVASKFPGALKFFGLLVFIVFLSILLNYAALDMNKVTSSTTWDEYHDQNINVGAVHIESILKTLDTSISDTYSENLRSITKVLTFGDWGKFNWLKSIVQPLFSVVNFVYTGFICLGELCVVLFKLVF